MCVNYVFCVVFDCWMIHDGRWCWQTIFGRPDIASVMQLLEDGERFRVVARRLHFPPSVVGRLWRSYQDTGEYTRRQGQGRSRVTTTLQDRLSSCCLVAITWVLLKRWKLTSVVPLKFTSPARLLGINSIMMVREPDDLPMAQFSLRNTVQCDSTLLGSIITGRFVTGCQYSSQMRAISLIQLMIDMLGCGDPRENVSQTVTLSKLTGTRRAHHGLDRGTLWWPYRPECVS